MQQYDNQRKTIKKWYSLSEYVDIDTGEIISKKKYEKEYYKINTSKKYELENEIGIRKFIHE